VNWPAGQSDLRAAWQLVCHDPFAILAPSAAWLGMDLVAGTLLALHWNEPRLLFAIVVGRTLFAAIARCNLAIAALQYSGESPSPRGATHYIATRILVDMIALSPLLFCLWLTQNLISQQAARGWLLPTAWSALFLLLVTIASWSVTQALFGTAPYYALVRGMSPARALIKGLKKGWFGLLPLTWTMFAGEMLFAAGSLFFFAGGLPARPLRDLATLHYWVRSGVRT